MTGPCSACFTTTLRSICISIRCFSMDEGSTFRSSDAWANSSVWGRYVWPFPVAWRRVYRIPALMR